MTRFIFPLLMVMCAISLPSSASRPPCVVTLLGEARVSSDRAVSRALIDELLVFDGNVDLAAESLDMSRNQFLSALPRSLQGGRLRALSLSELGILLDAVAEEPALRNGSWARSVQQLYSRRINDPRWAEAGNEE